MSVTLQKNKALIESQSYIYQDVISRQFFSSDEIIDARTDSEVKVKVLLKMHEDASTEYYSADPTMKVVIKASSLQSVIFDVSQVQL